MFAPGGGAALRRPRHRGLNNCLPASPDFRQSAASGRHFLRPPGIASQNRPRSSGALAAYLKHRNPEDWGRNTAQSEKDLSLRSGPGFSLRIQVWMNGDSTSAFSVFSMVLPCSRPTERMKRTLSKKNRRIARPGIRAEAESFGIDARVLGRVIARRPMLRSKLDLLARNAAVCARLLGVRRSEFIRLALVAPDLADVPAPMLMMNIRESSRYLRVSVERFKQLGLKAPLLFRLRRRNGKLASPASPKY